MPSANVIQIRKPAVPFSMERYELIFDQASDAICTVSGGRIEAVNAALEEITGYVRSEMVDGEISLLAPLAGAGRLPERSRSFSAELIETPGTYEDVAIIRKDGYSRLVELSVRKVREDEQTVFTLLIFRDVTAKKQMERELITKHAELRNAYVELERNNAELQAMQQTLVQAGKMAALGELAAGIAHELNQPLQAIRGYAQELQAGLSPILASHPRRAEFESYLSEVTTGVDKMGSIIKYLRSFTRKSAEGQDWVDVHATIDEALKMLGRQLASRGIDVERRFDSGLPKVFANPVQLEQVFINLATNARDAIEATGRGRGRIEIRTRLAGKFIEVVFQDDGMGMDERTKSKAFNPFFTTKEVGQGMGLGLSLSYGILSRIHGSIVVESEAGRGAEFLIRIPQDYRELG